MNNLIDYLKLWEEFRSDAYAATKDEADRGIYTIGYGFTSVSGKKVLLGNIMTENRASLELQIKIDAVRSALSKLILKMPNNYQDDAVISLAYNAGTGAFPTLASIINREPFDANKAYEQFFDCIYQSKKPLLGLIYRRACDANIFKNGVYEKRHYLTKDEQKVFLRMNAGNDLAIDMIKNKAVVK